MKKSTVDSRQSTILGKWLMTSSYIVQRKSFFSLFPFHFSLDSTQKQYLYILAQKEHIIGAYARNILQFADTLTYNEPIIWPSFLKTLEFKEPDNMHNYTDSRLKVYPNPANTYIIIEWNLLSLTDAIINIYDMNSQVLENIQPNKYHSYSILNTKKYSSGIYLCRISNGDGIQETVKFVINH
ncbi:MAG: T9SS type A sorting domain-containing protein [Bacteroidetes bacterium]|nr:T9SS type A sorting domain-containing protein [Bacteroidota bacterium]